MALAVTSIYKSIVLHRDKAPMLTDRSRFLASVSPSSALINLEEARGGVTKGSRSPDPFQRERNALIGHFTARLIR